MKISVVIPNFNYGRFLIYTLESIFQQNYDNFEVIIVDGGSSDNSREIIQLFKNKYPDKITFIKQKSKGQTSAVNEGLQIANGEIITWINSDDKYTPKSFNLIINYFNLNPHIDAIFGNINLINEKGNYIKTNKYLNFKYIYGVADSFGKIIPSMGTFWRSYLTNTNALLNESYKYAMDGEYWSRIFYKKKVVHVTHVLAEFRQHKNSITNKRQKKHSLDCNEANRENLLTSKRSFYKLPISKYINFAIFRIILLYFKIERRLIKFIKGYYF